MSYRPFFGPLVDYIISGPVVAMVWEGNGVVLTGRKIIGTVPSQLLVLYPLSCCPFILAGNSVRPCGRVQAPQSPLMPLPGPSVATTALTLAATSSTALMQWRALRRRLLCGSQRVRFRTMSSSSRRWFTQDLRLHCKHVRCAGLIEYSPCLAPWIME